MRQTGRRRIAPSRSGAVVVVVLACMQDVKIWLRFVVVCVATDPVAALIACAIIVVMGSRDELGANEGCLFSTVVLTTVVAAIPALAPRQHEAPDGCIEFVDSLGGGLLLSIHNDSCRLES